MLGDVVDLTTTEEDPIVQSMEAEMEAFVVEPVRVPDPLQWWRVNEGRFPHLAPLAKEYLAIPATEVVSERIFSTAGQTVSKLRARLDGDTVDKIIFLHKNAKTNARQLSAVYGKGKGSGASSGASSGCRRLF